MIRLTVVRENVKLTEFRNVPERGIRVLRPGQGDFLKKVLYGKELGGTGQNSYVSYTFGLVAERDEEANFVNKSVIIDK